MENSELLIDNLVIHKWMKEKNISKAFSCAYWDCSLKIQNGEVFYTEVYPDGNMESYCIECAAFFMAQALDKLIDKLQPLLDQEVRECQT